MTLARVFLLVHLVGFATFLGGAFAQQEFMKRSARDGLSAAVRDEYERLSAAIVTKLELPGLFAQIASGIGFIALNSSWLQAGWLHAKLTAVALLLVLSHVEMFNARKLVRARAQRGDAAAAEIATRKKRHAQLGAVGTVLVVAVIGLVVYGLRP
ncbi:MAG TPA: DUF2269 family protein [Labilithrix sp.]|jgi:uncharacterized membrane protein